MADIRTETDFYMAFRSSGTSKLVADITLSMDISIPVSWSSDVVIDLSGFTLDLNQHYIQLAETGTAKFTNGNVRNGYCNKSYGGGFITLAQSLSELTLDNIHFYDCKCDKPLSGGVVGVMSATHGVTQNTINVTSCTFNGCTSNGTETAGCILVPGTGSYVVTVSDCNFSGCSGGGEYAGGCIYVPRSTGTTTVKIERCTFSNNNRSGTLSASTIFVYNKGVTIDNCTFEDNNSDSDALVVYLADRSDECEIKNCTFDYYSGIMLHNGRTYIIDTKTNRVVGPTAYGFAIFGGSSSCEECRVHEYALRLGVKPLTGTVIVNSESMERGDMFGISELPRYSGEENFRPFNGSDLIGRLFFSNLWWGHPLHTYVKISGEWKEVSEPHIYVKDNGQYVEAGDIRFKDGGIWRMY